MKIISLLILGVISSLVIAEEERVLSVDRSVSSNLNLEFPNENKIAPQASDFQVVNYVLMSSDDGERWAAVTLSNLSAGSRTFENEHLLALFANGSRRPPNVGKLNFFGGEMQTITLSFGKSRFPILQIYSSKR
ncbi:MAG: hypothetical protein KUG78_02170 [Kangiellaceae bacterium]|nr:hypothetical protein [Kangiellaceae bacterium]